MLFSPLSSKKATIDCSKGCIYSSFSNNGMITIFEIIELSAGFFQAVRVTGVLQDATKMTAKTARRKK
jgi:hypothetical protein